MPVPLAHLPGLFSPKITFGTVAYFLIRLIIVSVFSISAALKSYQLLYHPAPARFWFQQPAFQILGIELELLVGFLLFSGWPAHWMARIAAGYLAVLAAISGSMLIWGETSCGCFGRWAVHPSWTLSFNLAAIVGLSPFWRKGEWSAQPFVFLRNPMGFVLFLAFWGAFLVFGQPSIGKVTGGWDPSLSHQKELDYQELDPPAWTGKPLPILEQIETDQDLRKGRWMVILYHRDCPRCDRVILDSYKHETILRGRLLLVEVPHLEPTYAKLPTSYGREIRMAKLSLSKKWLVATPVLIHLEEGVVRQVGTRWDRGVLEGFSP